MNPKTLGAAVLGVTVALGGAYEVAVEECAQVVYVDTATKTQVVARVCGGKVADALPSTASIVSVSEPKSKLLASSKATLAAEEIDQPCACAPFAPAKESVPCEIEQCAMGGKDCKWLPAPTLSTLAAGTWRGDCIRTTYGCTISEVRDACAPGDPCFMSPLCRDPRAVEAEAARAKGDAQPLSDPAAEAKEVLLP